ncbi:polysaccharide lyase 6 family protein [Simiduia agarivorans]|uniref:Poly(Beta-D-mannuronate) lyase n=1 Tax=Simiduia agarivorans (strain DSM 21679 / JCM 13881 / BCRC 17597 / SA1) TaxID=1117647 RepID=K4KJV5_SIMAS|nr:polysaccharide lyase 6 family protein [Simiduia agarivorans]AFU99271.1 Poly(beta-D-mannuronate) lyase [Simiduia agarivorans SA1 = DSM 21679]
MLVSACGGKQALVSNATELSAAIASAQPGQTITLRNGEWKDVEILFEVDGQDGKPITLKAETAGKVLITGESNLTLAGDYLVVDGLVFTRGYSPTGSVISFRKDKQTLANYSRVTNTVIDRFNKPGRFEPDIWVTLYGRHNRFDHNHLVGKMNQGVTLAVRLDTEQSQQNHHKIDHNYFGPRQVLGSNGGETLRIGTSHYSLSDSFTEVSNNWFDRCDGEVEIISVKSGKNSLTNNVFFESAGTLTLRHGNGNIIENNVFLGNNKPHTGGIRVINADHQVRNNYLSELTGYRFGGGLVVMNGVPNSPINRYHAVKNVTIENNTLVDVAAIQLAAGSDAERSETPSNTKVTNNLFIATGIKSDPITAFDDVSGMVFSDNGASNYQTAFPLGSTDIQVEKNTDGLWQSKSTQHGMAKPALPVQLDQVGVDWFPKGDARSALDSGRTIHVKPGYQALEHALKQAAPGDVLMLAAGDYQVDRVLEVPFAVTIQGPEAPLDALSVTVRYSRNALFEIQDGGQLALRNLLIDGAESDDTAGNTLIRTSRYDMLNNYRLLLSGVWVRNLDVNHSYSLLKVAKSTMADEIRIENSRFSDITGDMLKLDAEIDDLGIFNADYVVLRNNQFERIQGKVLSLYRGGTDESTFGPHLILENNQFTDSGRGKRNQDQLLIDAFGAQVVTLKGNQLSGSGTVKIESRVGEPLYEIADNQWRQSLLDIRYRGEPVALNATETAEETAK